MNKMEFSGKTIDDVLTEAAKVLGVDRSAVSYNVLPSAKGGLLSKLFSRSVRIEAWTEKADDLSLAAQEAVREIMDRKSANRAETPERTEKKRGEEPRVGRRGRNEKPQGTEASPSEKGQPRQKQNDRRNREAGGERKGREPKPREDRRARTPTPQREEGESAPRNLLSLDNPQASAVLEEFKGAFLRSFDIAGNQVDEARDETGNVTLIIQDEYLEGILAKSDRLSLAFEHIFKRVAQKRVGDVGGRVYLSAGKADEIRQQGLRDFAHSLAEKVRKTGKAITVASKTSQERRIIHLTLDGMAGVATRSVGTGDKRRLIVYATEARVAGRRQGAPGPEAAPSGAEDRRRSGKKRRGRGGRRPEADGARATPSDETAPSESV